MQDNTKLNYTAINLAPLFHQGLMIFADLNKEQKKELAFAHSVICNIAGNLQILAHAFNEGEIDDYADFLRKPLIDREYFEKIAKDNLTMASNIYKEAYGVSYPKIDVDYLWRAFTFAQDMAFDNKNAMAFVDPVEFQYELLHKLAIAKLKDAPKLDETQLMKMLEKILADIKTMSPERKADVKHFTERILESVKEAGLSLTKDGQVKIQRLLDALDIKASVDFNEPKQDFEDQKLQNLIKKLLD